MITDEEVDHLLSLPLPNGIEEDSSSSSSSGITEAFLEKTEQESKLFLEKLKAEREEKKSKNY